MDATPAWWVRHALLPAVLVAVALVLLRSGGDQAVAGAFYDSATRHWLLGAELHGAERVLIGCVMAAVLAAMAWRRWRRPASYLLLCFALSTSFVALGKHTTHVDCPRDLAAYGGPERHGGQCFPAGHSSSAFSLVALYFLIGDLRPRGRWAGLGAGLALGLAFAATQWARGMHFPSHDVISASIAWFVALGAYTSVYRRRLWSPGHAPAAD